MSDFSPNDVFGEVIHRYTRAQSIDDGMLVDLSEWASAKKGFLGGFKIPVALTASLWARIESIPEDLKAVEDVRGRAHDVLFMASVAARRFPKSDRARFKVTMSLPEGRRTLELLSVCGPGDAGEPVVTIGFPEDF